MVCRHWRHLYSKETQKHIMVIVKIYRNNLNWRRIEIEPLPGFEPAKVRSGIYFMGRLVCKVLQ